METVLQVTTVTVIPTTSLTGVCHGDGRTLVRHPWPEAGHPLVTVLQSLSFSALFRSLALYSMSLFSVAILYHLDSRTLLGLAIGWYYIPRYSLVGSVWFIQSLHLYISVWCTGWVVERTPCSCCASVTWVTWPAGNPPPDWSGHRCRLPEVIFLTCAISCAM